MANPSIRLEYDRLRLRVVRTADESVLVETSWGDDAKLEAVADTLSSHGCGAEADTVRLLMATYGRPQEPIARAAGV